MDFSEFQNFRIQLKAYESSILENVCEEIVSVIKACGVDFKGPVPLPTKLRRYCILTSPHVNKKARDHFEIRNHKRIIEIYQPTKVVLENLRDINISAGVDVEVKTKKTSYQH
jgi:small subunit ribosomal protein S10